MGTQPIISVVIPVYNAESYLDNCIQSVLKQGRDFFELVLVNDGSTDKSGIICDTWALEDSRINVFHTENRGAAAARNYGVKRAKGDYITFVDSDDTVAENYLEYLYDLAKEYGSDIAVASYRKVYPNDKNSEVKKIIADDRYALSGKEAMENLLYQKNMMSVPWGTLYRKDLFECVSFPEGTKAEDMGTIYRLYATAKSVAVGTEVVYYYYQREMNTVFSTSQERNRDYFKHCREMLAYVKKNEKDCMPAAMSRHFSACFQILSETPVTAENQTFIKVLYADIKKCQNVVLKDKKARIRNRMAALASLVSVRFMHVILRLLYCVQKKRVTG